MHRDHAKQPAEPSPPHPPPPFLTVGVPDSWQSILSKILFPAYHRISKKNIVGGPKNANINKNVTLGPSGGGGGPKSGRRGHRRGQEMPPPNPAIQDRDATMQNPLFRHHGIG